MPVRPPGTVRPDEHTRFSETADKSVRPDELKCFPETADQGVRINGPKEETAGNAPSRQSSARNTVDRRAFSHKDSLAHGRGKQLENTHVQTPESREQLLVPHLTAALTFAQRLEVLGNPRKSTVERQDLKTLVGTRNRRRLVSPEQADDLGAVHQARGFLRIPQSTVGGRRMGEGKRVDTIAERVPAVGADVEANAPGQRRLLTPTRHAARAEHGPMHRAHLHQRQPPQLALVGVVAVGAPALRTPAAPGVQKPSVGEVEQAGESCRRQPFEPVATGRARRDRSMRPSPERHVPPSPPSRSPSRAAAGGHEGQPATRRHQAPGRRARPLGLHTRSQHERRSRSGFRPRRLRGRAARPPSRGGRLRSHRALPERIPLVTPRR